MPEPMVAYLGDPDLKARVLAGLEAHRAADEIVQGVYWENGRGCAVGCVLHDLNPRRPASDHTRFEDELGIPEQLAWLIDGIFEALPAEHAKDWPLRVMAAIPVGADLSGVWDRFASWMLHDLADAGHDPDGVVSRMAGLFDRAISGDEPGESEWHRAADAAADARVFRAAWAAWDAWYGRDARDARDARAARDALAARAAAGVAARADRLVALVEEAPAAARTRL